MARASNLGRESETSRRVTPIQLLEVAHIDEKVHLVLLTRCVVSITYGSPRAIRSLQKILPEEPHSRAMNVNRKSNA